MQLFVDVCKLSCKKSKVYLLLTQQSGDSFTEPPVLLNHRFLNLKSQMRNFVSLNFLANEGIYHQRNVSARSAELLSFETGLI